MCSTPSLSLQNTTELCLIKTTLSDILLMLIILLCCLILICMIEPFSFAVWMLEMSFFFFSSSSNRELDCRTATIVFLLPVIQTPSDNFCHSVWLLWKNTQTTCVYRLQGMNTLLKVHLGVWCVQDFYRISHIPNTDTQREVKMSFSLNTPYVSPELEIKAVNVHKGFNKSLGGGEWYSADDYKGSETRGKWYWMCKKEPNAWDLIRGCCRLTNGTSHCSLEHRSHIGCCIINFFFNLRKRHKVVLCLIQQLLSLHFELAVYFVFKYRQHIPGKIIGSLKMWVRKKVQSKCIYFWQKFWTAQYLIQGNKKAIIIHYLFVLKAKFSWVHFPCVSADTFTIRMDLRFLYNDYTASPHVLRCRMHY